MLTLEQRTIGLSIIAHYKTDIDAMQLCREYHTVTDERVDWHEWARYLDHLHEKTILRYSGNKGIDGFTRYELNRAR